MIHLYYTAVKNPDKVAGQAYNIGGGMKESLSLLELFDMLNEMLSINMKFTKLPWRLSDQKVFVADITKIKNDIGWEPKVSAGDGISKMIDWVKEI
jgi:CDP-paratose 2-epimerase